jgi:hypothetical protein
MGIRIPIISDFQGDGIKQAKIAFGKFKTAVSDAEGGLGKFKAGAGSIMNSVADNAGTFAIAGAAAFGAFALSGIKAFSDLALESGKFADATGLAVEDASRWKEVGGDIGINTETLQTGIGKMNKVLGTSPKLFQTLGIEVKKTKDGATDVNGTFLNVIERLKGIKDPAEKAQVATQLLGKGWQSMAELINVGSVELTNSLRSVSNEQVISADELRKAREYRASMDNLGDSVQKLKLAAGQDLIPILAAGASGLATAINAFSSEDPLQFAIDQMTLYSQGVQDAREDSDDFKQSIKDARNPLDNLTTSFRNAKIAINEARAAWSNLIGQFERQVSFDKLDADLDTLLEKAIAAFGGGKAEMDAFHEMQLTVAQDFAKFAENFPPALSTQITVAINSGDIDQLEYAASLVKFLATPISSGGDDPSIARRVSIPIKGKKAAGGPVTGGSTYLVGERGPELFTPTSSGNITPNGAMGGNTITVNVNGGDPNQVVAALQRWVRDNGAIPMTTTTAIRR